MSKIMLPVHPLTGDTALGLRKDGRPIWPIKGGSGEGDPAPEVKPEGDPAPEPKPEDDDQLGEAGTKALKAERAARKAAETELAEAKAEAARLRRSNAATRGTDLDAIREEIRGEFKAELVKAALRAEAKGRLRNADDAAKFIDSADLDGADAVKAAVDALLKERPYLAAEPEGWGDVGGGKHDKAEQEPASPVDRMRLAFENNTK
ncbi:hypothetical protein AB0F32_24410 [Streptomyces albidoflavus]|uniref:hypothetical protein n=1 Tax=Streptomyces albidoflavus TaxID=1886 RepID=UPI0033FA480C